MSAKPPVVPTLEVRLPDLGTPGEVTVLELLVRVGDQVEKEQALLTLESEKATMDVPATAAGKVARILVKAGDKVSSGTAVLELEGPRQIVAEEVDAAPAAPQAPRTPRQAEPFGGEPYLDTVPLQPLKVAPVDATPVKPTAAAPDPGSVVVGCAGGQPRLRRGRHWCGPRGLHRGVSRGRPWTQRGPG